ncbi:hypothetical protein GCM10011571_15400 [Marinithermofilum abyssi]|uniref:Endonuclease/exonuclease/phosphatase domain-containing protein n=1 Tax=Marinithermofilum abyssi TaxID=1571185 RepID=A0A8J2VDN9_9BACL|nr:endonuclease/exonuclease/phosphatase family protein [Marinithermofilum abyssi]GGE14817.1 hypothetical protein GCM10011571_15400 [Marinithermofilum abyssi]
MRVVSYNIRHGVGCDKRLDLERTARVIEELQPDMVGLNEVDVCFHRRSEYQDQMAWLAKRLKMNFCFAPAICLRPRSTVGERQYGNGLLTKGKILDWLPVRFSGRNGDEPRSILTARVETKKGVFRIVVTHMGLTPWMRRRQVQWVLDMCRDEERPVVAMGDWNVTPRRRSVTALSPYLIDLLGQIEQETGQDLYTYPCWHPRKRLDYILCSPHFQVRSGGVSKTPDCPSDHLPVYGDLQLTGE